MSVLDKHLYKNNTILPYKPRFSINVFNNNFIILRTKRTWFAITCIYLFNFIYYHLCIAILGGECHHFLSNIWLV